MDSHITRNLDDRWTDFSTKEQLPSSAHRFDEIDVTSKIPFGSQRNLVISSLENTSINGIVVRTSDAVISKVQVRRYPNLSSTIIEKR